MSLLDSDFVLKSDLKFNILWLIAVVSLCGVLLDRWRWKSYRCPPLYYGALPIVGHLLLVYNILRKRSSQHLWTKSKEVTQHCSEMGGIVTFHIGVMSGYMITDPEAALVVSNACLNRPYLYEFANDVIGHGLLNSEAEKWKRDRKLFNPAFGQQVLNTYVDIFNERSRDFVTAVSVAAEKGPFNVQPYYVNTLLKTFGQTNMGISPDESIIGENYGEAVSQIINVFLERAYNLFYHIPFIFNMTSLKKKQDALVKVIRDISDSALDKRKLAMADENYNYNIDKLTPLLDQMLMMKEKNNVFTDEEIRDHIDSFLIGSFDTMEQGMLYILLFIGQYQDVQDRVYQEIMEVVQNEDVTKYDLPKLVYTEAVIKESVRLYPPVPYMARKIETDVKLKNYTLKSGTTCGISLYGINRLPIWGDDANEFRPERWLEPNCIPQGVYASFSFGKRNCIGRQYGIMSLKTTLAHLLRRYRVRGNMDKVELKYAAMLKPVSGHEITLESRS